MEVQKAVYFTYKSPAITLLHEIPKGKTKKKATENTGKPPPYSRSIIS